MKPGILYRPLALFGRFVFWCAVRQHVIGRPLNHVKGPCVLAINHISHQDPILFSVLARWKIDWMARQEFFNHRWLNALMHTLDAFAVDRWGQALPGIRKALSRLEQGRIVGVFPEGEVMQGTASLLNGGPFRYGAFLLARKAKVPVVPCVILGSPAFDSVRPWLPCKSGKVWVAFGDPIEPNLELTGSREGRQALGDQVAESMRRLYGDLIEQFSIPEASKHV